MWPRRTHDGKVQALTEAQIAALATPLPVQDFTNKAALKERVRRFHWLYVYELARKTAEELRDHFGFTGDEIAQADGLLETLGLRLAMVVDGEELKRVQDATYAHDPSAPRHSRRPRPAHKL